MKNALLTKFSRTFKDVHQEELFTEANWEQYSSSLRVPLLFLAGFILAGGYFDYGWYGLTFHFIVFFSLRLLCAAAVFMLAWSSYSATQPRLFEQYVRVVQLLVLGLWFAIFVDRVFFNDGGITSESFYTVLFVTYPFLVFYVIRGRIMYSVINSVLALLLYIVCVALNPISEIQFRGTEILVLVFFIYYSFALQRKINIEERLRFDSEQKQEASLKLANKESEEKSLFIAATSHDLRQPLHALSLYIDILQNSANEKIEAQEIIAHAKSSVSSLNDLLIALLDISKLDAGDVELNLGHFRVDELLNRMFLTYQEMAESKGLQLIIRTRELVAVSDPVMLERALGNLLNNAIQHTNEGKILLACRPKAGKISVEVWDQGGGVPAADLERIFSEYYRGESAKSERREGLGLGLAIVKKIAKALDLRLAVRSCVGQGSVFSLQVDRGNSAEIPSPVESENFGLLSLAGEKMLVVDDELEVQRAMKILLESWGCEVTVAGSQKELLPLLKQEDVPSVIICDLNLPEDVTGIDLIRNVRQYYGKTIPALLVTGDTTVNREKLGNVDSLVTLFKPLRAAKLRIALSRVCTA